LQQIVKKITSNSISFVYGFAFLLLFSALVGLFIFGLQYQNKQRKIKLIEQYSQEIKPYIEKHNDDIIKIFTEVIPTMQTYCNGYLDSTPYNCPQLQKTVFKLFPNTDSFSNFSSTSFIKNETSNNINSATLMELSGELREININQEMLNLLEGKTNDPIIGNFYFAYYYPGNSDNIQVAIPIKNSSGETIGVILRNVIE